MALSMDWAFPQLTKVHKQQPELVETTVQQMLQATPDLLRVPVSGALGMLVRLVRLNHIALDEAKDLLRQMIIQGYRSPLNKLDTLLM